MVPVPSPSRRETGEGLDAPLDVDGRLGREADPAAPLGALGALAEALRGRLAGAAGPACSVLRSVGVLGADGPCAEREGRGRLGPERRGGMLAGAS